MLLLSNERLGKYFVARRYFSQVRMVMCGKRQQGAGMDADLRPFHAPGRAAGYLNRVGIRELSKVFVFARICQ